MSHLKDILLDDPCPDLICGICNDILDDPMQVHCSEDHMFCRRCLNNYEKPSCPLCMEPLDKTSFQLSKFVKRQISRLRVRCIYKPLGCSWEGVLEDNHSASCNYQSIPCPNTHRGCTEKIGIMEIDRHRLECPFELLACPNNAQKCKPYLRKDIHVHNAQCSAFRCHFAFEGCPFTGTLTEVNQHVDNYCGKIHERIRELELQCQQLKQQLEQQQQQKQQDVISSTLNIPQSVDASMDEMALFHQMFNNGFIGMNTDNTNNTNSNNNMNIQGDTINTASTTITSPTPLTTTINNNNSNMNVDPNTANLINLANLPTIPLLTIAPLLSSSSITETSPDLNNNKDQMILMDKDPLSTTATTPAANLISSSSSAPKRSTNGKIIRYSKNKQLAHGALRLARQRSSSNGGLTTEAILNALHVATSSKSNNDGDEDINMKGTDSDLQSNVIHPSNNIINSSNSNNNNDLINNNQQQQQQQQLSPRNTSNRVNNNNNNKSIGNEGNNNNNNNNSSESPSSTSFAFKSLDDVTKFLEELPPIVEASPFLSPQHGKKQTIKHRSNSDRTNKSKINNDSNNNTNNANNNIRRQSKSSSTNNINEINHQSTPPSIPNSPMELMNNIASPPLSVSSTTTTVKPMFVLASSFLSKSNQDSPTN